MSTTVSVRQGVCPSACSGAQLQRQRGLVLILALIVLVAMTLASVAMVRSVDTSTIIAGNLAFKQSGAAAGDVAIDEAIEWLVANNGENLTSDKGSSGYYATSQKNVDITGNQSPDNSADNLDWHNTGTVKALPVDPVTGNQMSYVIHRMCEGTGAIHASRCATDTSVAGGNSQGGKQQMLTYQPGGWDTVANRAYYRITVRVSGPRNSVNFVQMIVAI